MVKISYQNPSLQMGENPEIPVNQSGLGSNFEMVEIRGESCDRWRGGNSWNESKALNWSSPTTTSATKPILSFALSQASSVPVSPVSATSSTPFDANL